MNARCLTVRYEEWQQPMGGYLVPPRFHRIIIDAVDPAGAAVRAAQDAEQAVDELHWAAFKGTTT